MHSGSSSFWVKVLPGFFEAVAPKGDVRHICPHFSQNPLHGWRPCTPPSQTTSKTLGYNTPIRRKTQPESLRHECLGLLSISPPLLISLVGRPALNECRYDTRKCKREQEHSTKDCQEFARNSAKVYAILLSYLRVA
jgi:hypothetical protein